MSDAQAPTITRAAVERATTAPSWRKSLKEETDYGSGYREGFEQALSTVRRRLLEPLTLAPLTQHLTCCRLPCSAPAEWVVTTGPKPDDYTHACSIHLAEMVGGEATISRLDRRSAPEVAPVPPVKSCPVSGCPHVNGHPGLHFVLHGVDYSCVECGLKREGR